MTNYDAIKLIAEDNYSASRRIKRFLEGPEGLLVGKRIEESTADLTTLRRAVEALDMGAIEELREEVLFENHFRTTSQLKKMASEAGVSYYGRMTRDELLRALK